MKTGWHKLPDNEYFSLPALSASAIKHVYNGGPRLLKAMQKIKRPPSKSMLKGTATHYACFEPETFEQEVFEMPNFSGDGSVARKKKWVAECPGSVILTAKEYDEVCRMGELVRAYAGPFSGGLCEVTGYLRGENLKSSRKIKVDYLQPSTIWDLKTSTDVSRRKFFYASQDYRYDIQAAWYEGTAYLIDGKARTFRWIVVKNSDPMDIRIYDAGVDMINEGREKYNRALDELYEAIETGVYEAKIETLDSPFGGDE